MSQDAVEVLRKGHDTFNRRDLDGHLAVVDPEVEFTPYERMVQGAGPYVGHEGVMEWWIETFEVIPDLTSELYEVRDLGEGFVYVHGQLSGSGAGSGAPIERNLWQAAEVREGKTVWWVAVGSEAEALEAAATRKTGK